MAASSPSHPGRMDGRPASDAVSPSFLVDPDHENPGMSGMIWTAEMIETLRRLWGQGFSARAIADHIPGCTKNSAIGKAHRLGLASRPSPIVPTGKPKRNRRPKPRAVLARMPNEVLDSWRQAYSAEKVSLHTAFRDVLEFRRSLPKTRRKPTLVEVPLEDSPGYTLEQVQDMSGCRWPLGAIRDKPMRWCGCEREFGSSYCPHHHALSRQRATGSMRAAERLPLRLR